MTCEVCDQLRSELAVLRGEVVSPAAREDRIRQAYPDLKPAEARLALHLFDLAGRVAASHELESIASPSPGSLRPGSSVVKIYVHRLRGSLGYHAVETVHSAGYRLSMRGLALIAEALEPKRTVAA